MHLANPIITALASISLTTGAGTTSCSVFVSDGALGIASANDACFSVAISCSGIPSGNLFPGGATVITYTAIDAAGNVKSATQTVTVVDTTPPTIIAPTPTSVPSDINCQAAIPNVLPQVSAFDDCGSVSLLQSPTAGTLVGTGPHTITITARDGSGNIKTATTTFTVVAGPSFVVSVTPTTARRGSPVTLNAAFSQLR